MPERVAALRTSLCLPLLAALCLTLPQRGAALDEFGDVDEAEPLYGVHIGRMLEAGLIIGHTQEGTALPKGSFGPADPLLRSEFAKIRAVTDLADRHAEEDGWAGMGAVELESRLFGLLRPYLDCSQGACASIGGGLFGDVPATDPQCVENVKADQGADSCEPWFARHVYYGTGKGYLKGYGDGMFGPGDSMLRIHALKTIIVDNGNIPPESDARYQQLAQKAEASGSHFPKCLAGAENYILDLNGGDTEDSQKLLAYALLADRLDFFGNQCQVFARDHAKTPRQRAEFLQKTILRQEVPRYMALTMNWEAVAPDPAADPTVNTAEENEDSLAGEEYEIPEYQETELLEDEPPPPEEDEEAEEAEGQEEEIPGQEEEEGLQEPPAIIMEGNDPYIAWDELSDEQKENLDLESADTVTVNGQLYVSLQQAQEAAEAASPFAPPISLGQPARACGPSGCVTLPAGTELEQLDIFWENGILWQHVTYNGGFHRVRCEDVLTQRCLDEIRSKLAFYGEDWLLEKASKNPMTLTESGILLAAAGDVALPGWGNLAEEWLKEKLKEIQSIVANLDLHYSLGHTVDQTVSYGLNGKEEGSWKYNAVIAWGKAKIIVNLESYYSQGYTADETVKYGLTNKGKDHWAYQTIVEWGEKRKGEEKLSASSFTIPKNSDNPLFVFECTNHRCNISSPFFRNDLEGYFEGSLSSRFEFYMIGELGKKSTYNQKEYALQEMEIIPVDGNLKIAFDLESKFIQLNGNLELLNVGFFRDQFKIKAYEFHKNIDIGYKENGAFFVKVYNSILDGPTLGPLAGTEIDIDVCEISFDGNFNCAVKLVGELIKIFGEGSEPLVEGDVIQVNIDYLHESKFINFNISGVNLRILGNQVVDDVGEISLTLNLESGTLEGMAGIKFVFSGIELAHALGKVIVQNPSESNGNISSYTIEGSLFLFLAEILGKISVVDLGAILEMSVNGQLILDDGFIYFDPYISGKITLDKNNPYQSKMCAEIGDDLSITAPYFFGGATYHFSVGAEVFLNSEELKMRDKLTTLGIRYISDALIPIRVWSYDPLCN